MIFLKSCNCLDAALKIELFKQLKATLLAVKLEHQESASTGHGFFIHECGADQDEAKSLVFRSRCGMFWHTGDLFVNLDDAIGHFIPIELKSVKGLEGLL